MSNELQPREPITVVGLGASAGGLAALRHGKEAGGLTVAQSPGIAEYPAMPQNADDLGLAEERRVLLFHTARELLFNVVKHAPDTEVELKAFETDSNVIVKDRGEGSDAITALSAKTKGFGLATLRQHLQLLGGSLAVGSVPGDGTRAYAAARQPGRLSE